MSKKTNKLKQPNGKKDMAVSGLIAFGAAMAGTFAQSGVSWSVAKLKEKPTILDKIRERKDLMYFKGEAIHRRYEEKKGSIKESAMINAKVELNNKEAVSELE